MTDQAVIAAALRTGGLIDMTTTGSRSGQQRRIEIVFFRQDGRIYISGMPGKRAWLANLRADPHFTFHLKKGLQADLPATARIVTDEAERRPVLARICEVWNRQAQTEDFISDSPLIEVTFEDGTLLGT